MEVPHHQSSEPPTVRVGTYRDPQGRDLEALIPAAEHPVGHRPAAVEQKHVDIAPLEVCDAARFVGRERVGSEECVVDVVEQVGQSIRFMRAHRSELHAGLHWHGLLDRRSEAGNGSLAAATASIEWLARSTIRGQTRSTWYLRGRRLLGHDGSSSRCETGLAPAQAPCSPGSSPDPGDRRPWWPTYALPATLDTPVDRGSTAR